ncbi:MAG TPA: RHS repeat-associated core domain-containing protein [Candidatus Kapabacteria bacterium]|nr:RHS repeat-associated core domain-containing protein [Candidatus Kapabacteria bacterium]
MKFKEYELKDHLGDVRATFNDLKNGDINNGFYLGSIETFNYYPFGMLEPTTPSSSSYRFGYNGMERDDEVKEKRTTLGSGKGNSYDYGARFYDPRAARWFSRDPFEQKYVGLSPYHYGFNNPIITIDPNGEENIVVIGLDKANNNRYNFIQSGLLQVNNYLKTQPNEKTTVLLFNDGYNRSEIHKVQVQITKMYNGKVNVELFRNNNLTNYLNSKNVENNTLSDEREADLVTDVSIFGHGFISTYEPNYSGIFSQTDTKNSWGINQAMLLDPKAFDSPSFEFFTCNAATINKQGKSLAEETAKQVKGKSIGWSGKTTYENINNVEYNWLQRQLIKIHNSYMSSKGLNTKPIELKSKAPISPSDRLPTGSSKSSKKEFDYREK